MVMITIRKPMRKAAHHRNRRQSPIRHGRGNPPGKILNEQQNSQARDDDPGIVDATRQVKLAMSRLRSPGQSVP
jgi:hypothetical protein